MRVDERERGRERGGGVQECGIGSQEQEQGMNQLISPAALRPRQSDRPANKDDSS